MCVDNSCTEKSIAIYHTTGAAIAGTSIPSNIIDPNSAGNQYRSITVINDTDQDIKFLFTTDEGVAGEFIVPKSIKGFTKVLKAGKLFSNSTISVKSMSGVSAAIGNIIFNFGS